ncbi:MAG: phosphate acyltransferase, partial [bacterium]
TTINKEMQIAAVYAIAGLAREDVPDSVSRAYDAKTLYFSKEYIIPKPLDPRLIAAVAPAVAKAAMESGVARSRITNWEEYQNILRERVGIDNQLISEIQNKAKQGPKRLVMGEANSYNVLKAAQVLQHQKMAHPILLGDEEKIKKILKDNRIELNPLNIVDYAKDIEKKEKFAKQFFSKRHRKGITLDQARNLMNHHEYYGVMMVENNEADAFVAGCYGNYANVIRPAVQVLGCNKITNKVAGMYVVMTKKGPLFFSDTSVNIKPDADTLVQITLLAAEQVRKLDIEPVIAFVSYSNFGLVREGSPLRVQEAIKILHENYPELIVDGEMQANMVFNKQLRQNMYPFCKLGDKDVNTIIFPNLSSGNITSKMIQSIGEGDIIGPLLLGLNKQVHVFHMDNSVREIVNLSSIAIVGAQSGNDCM